MKNSFGKKLKNLRIEKKISLREACRLTGCDASNWSKIERGILSPPSDVAVLQKWAKAIGVKGKKETQDFIDEASIAQGSIPKDLLSDGNITEYLPAFFRTLRSKKPNKKDTDELIKLIKRL